MAKRGISDEEWRKEAEIPRCIKRKISLSARFDVDLQIEGMVKRINDIELMKW